MERLHVLSCYAPTLAASREKKDEFFDTLQQALPGIQSGEKFVLLGDYNARVGPKTDEDDDCAVSHTADLTDAHFSSKEFSFFHIFFILSHTAF